MLGIEDVGLETLRVFAMTQIVSVHSFRRGVGKTLVAANMAVLLAGKGLRVGVMDINLAAPSLHILFGVAMKPGQQTLNDFVWGNCSIEEAVCEVKLAGGNGRLYLVPASSKPQDIGCILRGGYYVNFLADACYSFSEQMALDVLIVDTYAGLSEEVQLVMALAELVVIVMRPNEQDYVGTRTLMEIGWHLAVPQMALMINEVPQAYEVTAVQAEIERAFGHRVTAVLPHVDEIMLLGSSGVFVNQYANHWATAVFDKLSWQLSSNNQL